jgi:hypothetical protein
MKNRFTVAYEYLKNSTDLQSQIIHSFGYTGIKNGIPFVSTTVHYLDCTPFCFANSNYDSLELGKEEKNVRGYKDKYYFESYKDASLDTLNTVDSTDLFLIFSKPVNNYLPGIIFPKEGKFDYYGRAVKILFLFDKENKVIKVLKSLRIE